MAGKFSNDVTIWSHLDDLSFCLICLACKRALHLLISWINTRIWRCITTATNPHLVQMPLSLPRLGMHYPCRGIYFEKNRKWSADLSGCHWGKSGCLHMHIWIHSIELTVQTRLNKVALSQSPAASICAVRWVRSSHCGTNDWPAGRSTEPGEEPTSDNQQAKDSEWGWTENM